MKNIYISIYIQFTKASWPKCYTHRGWRNEKKLQVILYKYKHYNFSFLITHYKTKRNDIFSKLLSRYEEFFKLISLLCCFSKLFFVINKLFVHSLLNSFSFVLLIINGKALYILCVTCTVNL